MSEPTETTWMVHDVDEREPPVAIIAESAEMAAYEFGQDQDRADAIWVAVAGPGGIAVFEVDLDDNYVEQLRACVVCGCTDDRACSPPCRWIAEDRCSACEHREPAAHVAELDANRATPSELVPTRPHHPGETA